jgi:hypothetical protein
MSPSRSGFEPSERIKECVRGLRPWADLQSIGIRVEQSGANAVFSNPHGHHALVFPEDLAQGLTRQSGDSTRLKEWADVILGGSNFMELRIEGNPYGEALLEALWELSAGNPIRESAMFAARELFVQ